MVIEIIILVTVYHFGKNYGVILETQAAELAFDIIGTEAVTVYHFGKNYGVILETQAAELASIVAYLHRKNQRSFIEMPGVAAIDQIMDYV